MSTFLGVDGGGSKTRFLLIDEAGTVLARHAEGPAYYLEIGLDALRALLARGIQATLAHGGLQAAEVSFAFLGLPAYGEDTRLLPELDAIAAGQLVPARHRCGNDMVCGWAGALGGEDGINIVAGTGSIAYGEYGGRAARAGGFGELFSDEGSAYWLTREGLRLFTRMSDGRTARGALYDIVRRHFGLRTDLDLCAAIYGTRVALRSEFASLSRLVSEAAQSGDRQAQALFDRAAEELAQIIDAVHAQLQVPAAVVLPVSYSGGMFGARELLLPRLRAALEQRQCYRLTAPRLPPEAGAALYAARLAGTALAEAAMARLQGQLAPPHEPSAQ